MCWQGAAGVVMWYKFERVHVFDGTSYPSPCISSTSGCKVCLLVFASLSGRVRWDLSSIRSLMD